VLEVRAAVEGGVLHFATPGKEGIVRLEHYTEKPFAFDRDRAYKQEDANTFGKPKGLWVSVAGEDDWPSWCREESFSIGSLKHVAVVELDKSANLRVVSSESDLFEFHDQYAVRRDDDIFPQRDDDIFPSNKKRYWSLHWGKVAVDFDGLVIAPYLWSCRFDGPQWYYTIDCASGCIWNLDAISEIRREL